MTRHGRAALPILASLTLLVLAIAVVPRARSGERAGDAPEREAPGALERGRRLYLEGLLPDGRRLEAVAQGDVLLSGADAACVRCHQRSGYGASEGPVRAPAIVPSALSIPAAPAGGLGPRARDPSGDTSHDERLSRLARAVIAGEGRQGGSLARSMPRYRLAPDEVGDLAAYLASLDEAVSPGVTPGELRVATVVSDAVPAPERQAFIDTLEAYVSAKNGGSRGEERRAAHAPWPERNEYTAYRKWELDVWELTGPVETWGEQVRRRYLARPVFALVSGLLSASFEPIARACEALTLPCLYPITPLTGRDEPGFYTLHFSRGVYLDADVIARELLEVSPALTEVVQLEDDTPAAVAAAAALRSALERRALGSAAPAPVVRDLPSDAAVIGGAELAPGAQRSAVVAWLGESALERALAAAPREDRTEWWVSTRLADVPIAWLTERCSRRRCHIVEPTDPSARATDLRRFGAWARARGLPVTHPRAQLDAYFALLQLGEAVMHVRTHLIREFVVETIEHAAFRSLVTAGLPRVSLGSGQHFASLGLSITRLDPGGVVAAPRWLVP